MGFWENVRSDAEKGFKEGLNALRLKAEQLTNEGKRQVKLFDLKNKVHKEMADLGGAVYNLASKKKDPMSDAGVKRAIDRVKKLETQITTLEKKKKKKKKAAKKKVAKKKAAKKKIAKKK